MTLFVCLFVLKNLADSWTDIVLFNRVPSQVLIGPGNYITLPRESPREKNFNNASKDFFSMASKPKPSARLESVFSYTEKSFISSYHRQFSTNIKIKIIKLKWDMIARALMLWIFILISAEIWLKYDALFPTYHKFWNNKEKYAKS